MKTLTPAERMDLAAKARAIEDRNRPNWSTAVVIASWLYITITERSLGRLPFHVSILALMLAGVVAHLLSGWRYAFYLNPAAGIFGAVLLGVYSGPHLSENSFWGAFFLIASVASIRQAIIYARGIDGSSQTERSQIESWWRHLRTFPPASGAKEPGTEPSSTAGILLSNNRLWSTEVWLFRNDDFLLVATRFMGRYWSLRIFDAKAVRVEKNIEKRQLRIGDMKIRNVDFTPQLKDSLTEVFA